MAEIVLYTTHCPRCSVLQKKLDMKQVPYTVEDDVDKMMGLGIVSAPMLGVNGELLEFSKAVAWVNGYSQDSE